MIKKIIFMVFVLSIISYAQPTDYIDVLKSDVKMQRRALITEAMGLSGEKSDKFWAIHKEYETETDKLFDRELELLKEYADNYNVMTDEMADTLMNKALDINQAELDLQRKYYEVFKKELGAQTAAKFRMVDNRINLMINLQVAAAVPVLE